jgi:Lar family restriction alleviation protein
MQDELIKHVDPIECSFCGSKYAPRVYVFQAQDEDGRYQIKYSVRCLNCGARGPRKESGPHAIAAWNNRRILETLVINHPDAFLSLTRKDPDAFLDVTRKDPDANDLDKML